MKAVIKNSVFAANRKLIEMFDECAFEKLTFPDRLQIETDFISCRLTHLVLQTLTFHRHGGKKYMTNATAKKVEQKQLISLVVPTNTIPKSGVDARQTFH